MAAASSGHLTTIAPVLSPAISRPSILQLPLFHPKCLQATRHIGNVESRSVALLLIYSTRLVADVSTDTTQPRWTTRDSHQQSSQLRRSLPTTIRHSVLLLPFSAVLTSSSLCTRVCHTAIKRNIYNSPPLQPTRRIV